MGAAEKFQGQRNDIKCLKGKTCGKLRDALPPRQNLAGPGLSQYEICVNGSKILKANIDSDS